MNRNLTLASLLILVSTLFLTGGTNAYGPLETERTGATSGVPAPAPTPGITNECPDGIEKISDCPRPGCGENGDAFLNSAKNRVDIPNPSSIRRMSLDDMRTILQPPSWNTGNNRASITGTGKEGTPVIVTGFLLKAKAEGGESCNCDLTHRVDTDIHLALVSEPEDDEETSVTAEITPRVRRNGHDNWTFANLRDREGEFIRVTGWLMLDTKHIRQSHRLPHERLNKSLKRQTNWEVHPITKLEICTKSVTACNHGKGWVEF